MKKSTILLLAAVMLLAAGCAPQQTPVPPATEVTAPPTTAPEITVPETTVPETTEATEPVPETEDCTVQVNNSPAILMRLSRGDVVDVVGEYDETHFAVKTDLGYGLMEKQLLRFAEAEAYEGWTGYAYSGAEVFDNYQLLGQSVRTLSRNTEVEVVEALQWCYLVRNGDSWGFVALDGLSRTYLRSGGGGGGGGGADGGDITMGTFGGIQLLSVIEQTGEVTGQAEVLIDEAPVILGYFQRGDVVPVVTEEGFAPAWEGYATVYFDGIYAYMPQKYAQAAGQEAYEPWDGYSSRNAKLYKNPALQGDTLDQLSVNTVVTVLWDAGDCYVVSAEGVIGCMAKGSVSTSKHATGGGGGGGGGGDWTPPAL